MHRNTGRSFSTTLRRAFPGGRRGAAGEGVENGQISATKRSEGTPGRGAIKSQPPTRFATAIRFRKAKRTPYRLVKKNENRIQDTHLAEVSRDPTFRIFFPKFVENKTPFWGTVARERNVIELCGFLCLVTRGTRCPTAFLKLSPFWGPRPHDFS